MSYRIDFFTRFLLVAFFLLALGGSTAFGQGALTPFAARQFGKYTVTVQLPQGGLYAEEEQQIGFMVTETARTAAVSNGIRATVTATVATPSLPALPKFTERAAPEGTGGDLRIRPTFAQGGDYLLTVNVQPAGDAAFTAEFPLKVADYDDRPDGKNGFRPYSIELSIESGGVVVGQPTVLRMKILANREARNPDGTPSGKRETVPVRNFERSPERMMNLFIVRRDLGYFAHEFPALQPDGTFLLRGFRFPTSGEYRIFTEVAPRDAGRQVLASGLSISGKDKLPAPNLKTVREQRSDGILVSPVGSLTVPARKTAPVTFELRDQFSGSPAFDLQPFLGFLGNLVLVHQDGATTVHCFSDDRDPGPGRMGMVTIPVHVPRPGLYRGWFEFQHNGKLTRVDFVFTARAQ